MSRRDDILEVVAYLSSPRDQYPVFSLLKIFKSEFLIQDMISRPIVNETEISTNQNLYMGDYNQG